MKRSKKKKLIIVESPSKARTISNYLGGDFDVKASMGHIKDLPANRMGISEDLEPEYVVIKGKEKIIKELKKAAEDAEEIFLASDPDREGEAIAWHIFKEIGVPDKTYRIEFHEITKEAIMEALKNPRGIDIKRVNSQQARRVLDRIVGYSLSPLLWRKVDRGLSAGRVQSVALKLICEREKEIEAFVPEEYWKVEALLKGEDFDAFKAHLYAEGSRKIERLTEREAHSIIKKLAAQSFELHRVEKKRKKKKPLPPFITSTLQQEAFKRLNFSSSKTMYIAQQLYEGVDIPGVGRRALITYMRTDSVRVSDKALKDVRAYIKGSIGAEYLPRRAVQFKSKEGAQDAHEAIRPVDVTLTPQSLSGCIPEDLLRLYELIWRRFVASQMKEAVISTTVFHIRAGDYWFKASGSVVEFEGYRKIWVENEAEASLPDIPEGATLQVVELKPTQHFTKPPPRYTEATLIKTLEEKGVGRPSTYATIISTIKERGYVVQNKKALVPTPLGRIVSELLSQNFPRIMDVGFTAEMEKDLDRIARGEVEWKSSVRDFYNAFIEELEKASNNISNLEEYIAIKCEKCGSPMVLKKGKFGKFLACSGYPDCKNTKPLNQIEGLKGNRRSGKRR